MQASGFMVGGRELRGQDLAGRNDGAVEGEPPVGVGLARRLAQLTMQSQTLQVAVIYIHI